MKKRSAGSLHSGRTSTQHPATQRKTVIDRSLNDSIGSIVVCEAPKTVEQETIKMPVT